MIKIQGKGVYGGIAIGKLSFYQRKESVVRQYHINDVQAEKERFHIARQAAVKQLKELYDKAADDLGEEDAAIFEIHQMLLDDEDYINFVENIIKTQECNAEYAVTITSENFVRMFSAMEDSYMQGRAADIKDISQRVLTILSGAAEHTMCTEEPVIIAADDLAPSETVQLDKSKILGFVTMYGSADSHTAILARTMNLPAVIGTGEALKSSFDGMETIVDGYTGTVYIDPDEQTLGKMREQQCRDREQKRMLEKLYGKENITKSGQKISVCANIGNTFDVGLVLDNDGDGIGLFRSEFIYLGRADFPTEEEQFLSYKQVAEDMHGKKVIIRTLDIGADKQADYFHLDREENPALGYRAIRICLDRPDIFKTQLRAIYRASAFGNIAIMFPMITSVGEVRRIKEICAEVKEELDVAKLPYKKDMELGIMIETPAAALISRELAGEVDFFSVGTNDLTQYTLAVDRQNPKLDAFRDAHHPAVLELIRMAAESAHAQGKWIGICGELAADLELTEQFLTMGIDELSVAPGMILKLRRKIRECD